MNISKLIIFLGQFLKVEEFVSAVDLQHFIADEQEQGGYMLPLDEIRMVLSVMKIAGFLEEIGNGVYTLAKKEYVKKEVATAVIKANPI